MPYDKHDNPLSTSSSHLHLQAQPVTTRAIVRWGTKTFHLNLIQVTPQREEALIPLSDEELRFLIPKVEQALVRMQSTYFDPSQWIIA